MGCPTAANCSPCNIHKVCKAHAQTHVALTLISSQVKGGGGLAATQELISEQEHAQKSFHFLNKTERTHFFFSHYLLVSDLKREVHLLSSFDQ